MDLDSTVAREIEADPDAAISLQGLADYLPRIDGKKIHYDTLWRWHRKGLPGPGPGRRVFLETTLVGGKRVSTLAALKRFNRARNAAAAATQRPAPLTHARVNAETRRFLKQEGFQLTTRTAG